MIPSFFRLFQRGRYYLVPEMEEDSSMEAKAKREERERFAVAALAFCLRHDPEFRRHFWKTICRVLGDPPEMPPITDQDIELEPPCWADLRLTSNGSRQRFVWVVECKADAPLADIQNPTHSKWSEDGVGYGAMFAAAEKKPGTRMRYVVLGAKPLRIADGTELNGIIVQQRDWGAILTEGLKREGIVKDLIETFAELKIGDFYMEKAKRITVSRGLACVGEVWTVLDAICKSWDVKNSQKHFDPQPFDKDSGGMVGIHIKQPTEGNASQKQKALRKVTRDSGWCLAWFGYWSEPQVSGSECITKAVSFYCSDDSKRRSLLTKLKTRLENVAEIKEEDEDGAFLVTVFANSKLSNNDSVKDFDWFDCVLRNATD